MRLLVVSLIYSISASACIDPEPPTGELRLGLIGSAPSGQVYRLRDAIVIVDGSAAHREFDTALDPDQTAFSSNVPAGDYTATLLPGWRVERIQPNATTQVPATLISPNPVTFTVLDDVRTSVPLQFNVFNELVDLTQGFDIVAGFNECAGEETSRTDGIDNDCDGAIDCADTEWSDEPICIPAVCGDGVVTSFEQCEDGNTNDFDGCSGTCVFEIDELEPNEDGSPSLGDDFAIFNTIEFGLIRDPFTIMGGLSPAGDEDVFAIQNPSFVMPTAVTLELWDPAAGVGAPCSAIDPVLAIRDATGFPHFGDDNTNGTCPRVAFTLAPAQRLYIHITDSGDNSVIPSYAMIVKFL